MTIERLMDQAIVLMQSRRPTSCNRFLLYADNHRLGVSVIEDLPHSSWIIKSLSAEEINRGPTRMEWYRIYNTIEFLHDWSLLP